MSKSKINKLKFNTKKTASELKKKKKMSMIPMKGYITSCKDISFFYNQNNKKKFTYEILKSSKNIDRQTIQKTTNKKKKVNNFDTIFNSSTEIVNINSKNYKSQKKIKKIKLSEKETQDLKVSVVTSFLKKSGFPEKYIIDTVFEKDKQFTHIKSCFDQLIECL